MNWLDVVLIVLIGGSAIASFTKGFSREIIGLAASLAGLVCGIWFYGSAGAFLLPYVSAPSIANFLGFLIVFAGILLLGSLASAIVRRFVKTVGLSWFDRLLGAVFGVLRGLIVAVALILAIMAFAPEAPGSGPPQAIVHSRLAPYVLDTANLFAALAPQGLKDGFRKRYYQVKSTWNHSLPGQLQKQSF